MEFYLRQEVKIGDKAIRCSDSLGHSIAVGSFSKEVTLLQLVDSKLIVDKTFNFFDSDPMVIRFYSLDCLLVGLRNGAIVKMTSDGEIETIEHSVKETVSSIDSDGSLIYSGHWNDTFVVRSFENLSVLKTIGGHKYAVVLRCIGDGCIASSSQDGVLRIWDSNFEQVKETKAHTDIVRAIKLLDNILVTCSNDGAVRGWGRNLSLVFDKVTSSSFLFSVGCSTINSTNDKMLILTGGEERAFYVLEANHVNVVEKCRIPYPCTLWSIVHLSTGGLFVLGGDDGILRIFSEKKDGEIAPECQTAFLAGAEVGQMNSAQSAPIDLSKFPPKRNLNSLIGKKEGDVQVVVADTGKGEAYMWTSGKWEYVGEVQGGPTGSSYAGDSVFPAGEYDYIFDVENDSGGFYKLPYNKKDCPYTTADKFLTREQLPATFKEQIVGFIKKMAGDQQAQQNSNSLSNVLPSFPVTSLSLFEGFRADAFIQRTKQINDALSPGLPPAPKLSNREIAVLESLTKKVTDSRSLLIDTEIEILTTRLRTWRSSDQFIVIDLMRAVALLSDSPKVFSKSDGGLGAVSYAVCFLREGDDRVLCLLLRFLSNLSKHNYQALLVSKEIVLEALETKLPFTEKARGLTITFLANIFASIVGRQLDGELISCLKFLEEIIREETKLSDEELNFIGIIIGNCISEKFKNCVQFITNGNIAKIVLENNCQSNNHYSEVQNWVIRNKNN